LNIILIPLSIYFIQFDLIINRKTISEKTRTRTLKFYLWHILEGKRRR